MRNIIKKSLFIFVILIGIALGLTLIERAFFPKKSIGNKPPISQEAEIRDVNYKIAAYKSAIGKNKKSGGWYVSKNVPKKYDNKHSPKELLLYIDNEVKTLVEDKYLANKLILANNTEKEICFQAQDSNLFLVMQAKNYINRWKDIEYVQYSDCGNSYHNICLGSEQYWEFPSLGINKE